MDFVITWRELLIAVVLATVVYLLEAIFLSHRKGRAGLPSQSALLRELADLRQEVAGLRQRLDRLTEPNFSFSQEEDRRDPLAAYDEAVTFARQGLSAAEIAQRCGISTDEAALIVVMQKRNA